MERFNRLPPPEQALLQLCSIIHEPVDLRTLTEILRRTGPAFSGLDLTRPDILGFMVARLQGLQLLNPQLQCHEAIAEICSRQALNIPVEPLSNRFRVFSRAVQEVRPAADHPSTNPVRFCSRTFRDLRIALYSRDRERLNHCWKLAATHCPSYWGESSPLVRICNNPFDAEWFAGLPENLQSQVLEDTFHRTVTSLKTDREPLAYALESNLRQNLVGSERSIFYHHLISRLLLGGALSEAERLLKEIDGETPLFGMKGWIAFLRGRDEEAVASYEADLKALRRHARRKHYFFGGWEGIFFILALLRLKGNDCLPQLEALLRVASARHGDHAAMVGVYSALSGVLYALGGDSKRSRQCLDRGEPSTGALAQFFWAMASFWCEGRLAQEVIDGISDLFVQSREAGLDWLTMECAELLCRAEGDTPVRLNTLERIRRDTGMHSFVAAMQVEEPWRKSLRALALMAAQANPVDQPTADTRLIWLLDYQAGMLAIRAVEQKRTARGAWSKGRSVAVSRLYGGTHPDCMTEQDRAICAAIEREGRYWYNTRYVFNRNKLLPALIGHPRLFLEDAPTVPVEVVKGEPEVFVTREGARLRLRFSIEASDERMILLRETPTRFKVVQLSDDHLRIAGILGEKGLSVPASSEPEVLEAVAGITPFVTVHSAVGGAAAEIEAVPADPTPRIHILPAGAGLRFEMFVQPFGGRGPTLKPGTGMENLMAEIDGRLLQTRRSLQEEMTLAAAVEAGCPGLAAGLEGDRQWVLDDLEDCLQALLDLKTLQDAGGVVLAWPEGEKLRVTRELSFDRLRLNIHRRKDWFEVTGELQVDDQTLMEMRHLLDLLEGSRNRFIPLGEGQFVALTAELRKRLEDLDAFSERHGKGLRLHPLAALAAEDFTDRVPELKADPHWHERLEGFRSGLSRSIAVPSTLRAELRDYQVEGFQWLARLAHLGLGACLADDMGLGKTLQALALILERAPGGPTLVVAPTSVCMNWVAEADRFAPTLEVVMLGGNGRDALVKGLGPMQVLVTSYGLLYQEAELLASVQWQTIVLDEAQAIKNVAAKRSQAAMNLSGAFKLITTGTPIENHLGEFWTLFNFINPGLLGPQQRFNDRFAVPIERGGDREVKKRLKKLIKPFILRRTKAQVLEELPPRTEVVLHVEMSPEEAAFYEALRCKALERLDREGGSGGPKHLQILTEIMRLRQACCHPRLVAPGSPIGSSKLELFGEVVSELLENRHKALVFSQFVGHLQILREYLDGRSLQYQYLDGSTPPRERKRAVDAFQSGEGDLFLISLKAGGLGLNLTAADYVIHMDPWWNPAAEDQASDRAHRIGQRRPVTVYRLVTRRTIEEKILKLHQEKRDLAGSLLDGSDMVGKMSAEELLKLIRES